MELWIRSQEENYLINVSNLTIETYNGCGVIETKIGERIFELGQYASKGRAIEVLNEIEERIMLINTINIAKDTNSLIACKNALSEEKIKGLNYPYKMPEK